MNISCQVLFHDVTFHDSGVASLKHASSTNAIKAAYRQSNNKIILNQPTRGRCSKYTQHTNLIISINLFSC